MKTRFLKASLCALALFSIPAMASELSFPDKARCTTATDCAGKALKMNRISDAGKFIAFELKALEQLNYKKQKKGQYSDSKDALVNMVALFINGTTAMTGVYGGWVIQTDGTINITTGALLLAYEAEESRVEDPSGIDRIEDYQDALSTIRSDSDYVKMEALSRDAKKLADALLEEAKGRAIIVEMSI